MNRAKILLDKLKAGTLTEDERAQLEAWYNEHASASSPLMDEEVFRRKMSELDDAFPFHQKSQSKRLSLWPRIAAAAAIIVVLFGTGLWYFGSKQLPVPTEQFANDISPGRNGATLTLANGKKIYINDALAGNLAEELGVKVSKNKDGQIIYEVTSDGDGTLAYNTLTTTRGEQTQVRLPDGTLVFLNASSSLKYPNRFNNSTKRSVFLTGEGYFEVAKDKKRPFIVVSRDQSVEVLGTHFNINAYENSAVVKTTLIEGSVKVSNAFLHKVLEPGQQSSLLDQSIDVKNVEPEDAVAWKNGRIMYDGETLENIMKDVSRWYDVEIVFKNEAVRKETFFVSVSRWDNVSKLLKIMEKSQDISFEIKGKTIFVDGK